MEFRGTAMRRWAKFALASLVLFWVARASKATAERRVAVVVVVSKESKVESMSLKDLKRIFDGDNPSRTYRPFNWPARSQLRVAFDKKVLGLSPSAVGRYWIDRKVRGQRGAPRSLASSMQVAKVVARFPGAIGYMRADMLPAWVKPIKVSGKSHSDADYPIFIRVP